MTIQFSPQLNDSEPNLQNGEIPPQVTFLEPEAETWIPEPPPGEKPYNGRGKRPKWLREMIARGEVTPPKNRRQSFTGSSESSNRSSATDRKIRDGLNALFGTVATVTMFANEKDAQIIARQSPAVVDACVNLARQDEKFRAMLLAMLTGGAYTQLTIAIIGLILPILANHKLLPEMVAGLFGE